MEAHDVCCHLHGNEQPGWTSLEGLYSPGCFRPPLWSCWEALEPACTILWQVLKGMGDSAWATVIAVHGSAGELLMTIGGPPWQILCSVVALVWSTVLPLWQVITSLHWHDAYSMNGCMPCGDCVDVTGILAF